MFILRVIGSISNLCHIETVNYNSNLCKLYSEHHVSFVQTIIVHKSAQERAARVRVCNSNRSP